MVNWMLRLVLVLGILAGFGCSAEAGLLRKDDSKETIQEAVQVFEKSALDAGEGIPAALLHQCKAMAIFPSFKKVGLGFGVQGGFGLMLARGQDGRWSAPGMFHMRGVSTGWQAGAQSMAVVLLIMKEDTLKDFVSRKITLGAEASISVGPKGRAAEGNVLADMKAIYSYAWINRGVYAGIVIEGNSVTFDDEETEKLYGKKVKADDLLIAQTVAPPSSTQKLLDLLNTHCVPAEPAAPTTVPK